MENLMKTNKSTTDNRRRVRKAFVIERKEKTPTKEVIVVVEDKKKEKIDFDVAAATSKIRKGVGVLKLVGSSVNKTKVVLPKKHISVKRKTFVDLEGPGPEVNSTIPKHVCQLARGLSTPSKRRKVQKKVKILTRAERIEALKTQKVLKGRIFDPSIFGKLRMVELVEYVKCKEWSHMFKLLIRTIHEK